MRLSSLRSFKKKAITEGKHLRGSSASGKAWHGSLDANGFIYSVERIDPLSKTA